MNIPPSPEVRWHMATNAFEDEEPALSEETADKIALAIEAFVFALVVVILALVGWSVMS